MRGTSVHANFQSVLMLQYPWSSERKKNKEEGVEWGGRNRPILDSLKLSSNQVVPAMNKHLCFRIFLFHVMFLSRNWSVDYLQISLTLSGWEPDMKKDTERGNEVTQIKNTMAWMPSNWCPRSALGMSGLNVFHILTF